MTTETLIPVTLCQMGGALRLQPVVGSVDLLRFIFPRPSADTDPDKGMAFLPLEAARTVLEALLRRPEGQEYDPQACQRLLCWLRGYEQVRQSALLN